MMQRIVFFFVFWAISPALGFAEYTARDYLNNYEWEDEDWPEDDFEKLLTFVENLPLNPRSFRVKKAATLAVPPKAYIANPSVLDDQSREDLAVVTPKHQGGTYLASTMDRTHTEFGRVALSSVLATPIHDVTKLKQRQQMIQELLDNPELAQEIKASLSRLASHQLYLLSFFGRDPLTSLNAKSYFKDPRFAKANDSALILGSASRFEELLRKVDCAGVVCASAALVCSGMGLEEAAMGSFIEHFQDAGGEQIKRPFRFLGFFYGLAFEAPNHVAIDALGRIISLAGGVYGTLGLREAYRWDQSQYHLMQIMYDRLHRVHHFLKELERLAAILAKTNFLKQIKDVGRWIPGGKPILENLYNDTFARPYHYLTSHGHTLVAYRQVSQNLDKLATLLLPVGELDSLFSIYRLLDETPNDSENRFTLVEYIEADTPQIVAEGFWNATVGARNAVANSIYLGNIGKERNLLVMGPNSGGKSTLLRALAYNVVLAQTFGIAAADTFRVTPFAYIRCNIEITDDIDNGMSKFRSEASRAGKLLQTASDLQSGEFLFSVMDEMFSSTSPEEGQAAAYTLADQMGMMENVTSLLVSHYSIFREQTLNNFQHYHTTVTRSEDGSISFPYFIEPGVEHENVAFDILLQEGIANPIIEKAKRLVE